MSLSIRGPLPAAMLLVVTLLAGAAQAPGAARAVVAVGPTVTSPTVTYRAGVIMTSASYPVHLAWRVTAGTAALFAVQRSIDGAGFVTIGYTTTHAVNSTLAPGHAYRFRVRGYTAARIAGPWATGDSLTPRGRSEASTLFSWTGKWVATVNAGFWGGRARTSWSAGASSSFTLTGRSAALVAAVGPTRGSVRIYIDGIYRRTVSLYRTATAFRQVVWQITWPETGSRVIEFVVVGNAGHARVDVDGVLTLG